MVENTTQRDPLTHLIGMGLGSGRDQTSGYIEGMEAEGQRQMVASTQMPTEAPWDDLIDLGFTRGAEVPGDPLFCEATLPEGWSKAPTDHSMWSKIVDERGVERVGIFYKAAFYDRKAHANLSNPGYSLATDVLYGEGEVGLPAMWDVLTDDERGEFWDNVESMVEKIGRHPDIYGKYQPRVTALLALRDA